MVGRKLLEVQDLTVTFDTKRGRFDAVRSVSFHVHPGQVLGIVGESGSGKSVTAMALMRLLPEMAQLQARTMAFAGHDLARASERQMQSLRGGALAMVFQDPMSSLNPILTIGRQLREPLILQRGLHRRGGRRPGRRSCWRSFASRRRPR